MNPISIPSAPPQPNQPVYGMDALALFQRYTRDSYRAKFGVEAPAWDSTRGKKDWFDSTAIGNKSYTVAGVSSLLSLSLLSAEASTVNLPGLPAFEKWNPAPVTAPRADGSAFVNNLLVSTKAQADALAAELGGTNVMEQADFPGALITWPAGEERRIYVFTIPGLAFPVNVGEKLAMKYAKGIGWPGQWTGLDPTWQPGVLNDGISSGANTLPAVAMPLRSLLPNEKIGTSALSMVITRTDLASPTSPAGGSFTDADRVTLQHIADIAQQNNDMLKKLFGL